MNRSQQRRALPEEILELTQIEQEAEEQQYYRDTEQYDAGESDDGPSNRFDIHAWDERNHQPESTHSAEGEERSEPVSFLVLVRAEPDTCDEKQKLDDYKTDDLSPRIALSERDKACPDESGQGDRCIPPEVIPWSVLAVNHPCRVVPSIARVERRSHRQFVASLAVTQNSQDKDHGQSYHRPGYT